ncbi:MAG: ABC transporter substrate-binding protein [Mycobacterium sp.]
MFTKRRLFGTALAAATAASLIACSSEPSGEQSSEVRINQAFQSLLYLPLYVAIDEGYFEEQGVNVKLTTGGGGQNSWSSVLGGTDDFSIHDPVFAPISHENGGPGVAVASIQNAPAVWVVGNEDESLQADVTGFQGSSVVTMPEPDSTWAFFNYLMRENSLDPNTVDITEASVGNELGPFMSGRADYALATEPQVSQVEAQGKHAVFSFSEIEDWYPFAFSSLMSTEKYVDENPESTQKVVNALQQASTFIYTNTDEAVAIAQNYFPDLEGDVIASAVKRELEARAYPENVEITQQAWDNNMRIAAFVGSIKEYPSEATSFATNVNNTFAEKAAAEYAK